LWHLNLVQRLRVDRKNAARMRSVVFIFGNSAYTNSYAHPSENPAIGILQRFRHNEPGLGLGNLVQILVRMMRICQWARLAPFDALFI